MSDYKNKYTDIINDLRNTLIPSNSEWQKAEDKEVVEATKDLLGNYLSNVDLMIKSENDKLDFLEKGLSFVNRLDMSDNITEKEKYKTAIINLVRNFIINNDYAPDRLVH